MSPSSPARPTRRSVAKGLGWTVPVITLAAAAPVAAASTPPPPVPPVHPTTASVACKITAGVKKYKFTLVFENTLTTTTTMCLTGGHMHANGCDADVDLSTVKPQQCVTVLPGQVHHRDRPLPQRVVPGQRLHAGLLHVHRRQGQDGPVEEARPGSPHVARTYTRAMPSRRPEQEPTDVFETFAERVETGAERPAEALPTAGSVARSAGVALALGVLASVAFVLGFWTATQHEPDLAYDHIVWEGVIKVGWAALWGALAAAAVLALALVAVGWPWIRRQRDQGSLRPPL